MKKIGFSVVALLLLFACNNERRAKVDAFESLTSWVDSAASFHRTDSLEKVQEDEPLPVKADEIFDDFIYCFASDEKMQLRRILFPLPYYDQDGARKIGKEDWRHDSLFFNQDYYTLLFDREEDMDMTQDTTLTSVQYEWIDMKEGMAKKYYFERMKGAWMLEAVNRHRLGTRENEAFIGFFYRFANDSVFQSERLAPQLTFVTNDPEDDFSILETTIEAGQWTAFMPWLPKDWLTDINYGQQNRLESARKILSVKGVGNGFSNTLYFRRRNDGNWELYKFEDLSN